ncbi:hypothetical protein ACFUNF_05955 [Streptomyces sp. NPDC057291]|uniref:hypothetical protein n=1 Tax=Streptomyces sp. NPDC057291 TaxID=3346087 RepID=UPI0036458359
MAALTVDVTNGGLRAVLDSDGNTLWYALAWPVSLNDATVEVVEDLRGTPWNSERTRSHSKRPGGRTRVHATTRTTWSSRKWGRSNRSPLAVGP